MLKAKEKANTKEVPPGHLRRNKPKNTHESKKGNASYTFQRPPPENTQERLFDTKVNESISYKPNKKKNISLYNRDSIGGIFDSIGKRTKLDPIARKPCDGNFLILSTEAKNNVSKRYYFEDGGSGW